MKMQGWKILTSDYRPPLQGGEPIFDGTFPAVTTKIPVDKGPKDCSYGWNFVRDLETGFNIAGLWSTGRPNVAVLIEADDAAVERRDKCRAAQLNLVRFATPEEIQAAIWQLSASFGGHQAAMANEQWQWYLALGRPKHNRASVIAGLKQALSARQLAWRLKKFGDAGEVWAAWEAWNPGDAGEAWAAWEAWAANDAWEAGAALNAWAPVGNAWDANAKWVAGNAGNALAVQFAARSGWIAYQPDRLTLGIRDAYFNGLAVAVPAGPNQLGWAMEGLSHTFGSRKAGQYRWELYTLLP